MKQKDLEDALLVSQNKCMECTICGLEMGFNRDGDEEKMKQHFIEKHNYKEDE